MNFIYTSRTKTMTIETAKYNPGFLSEERLRESFVVRQDALQSILASIRENVGPSNQHVLVIGPRGMGKTMLMRRIAAAIREDSALSGQWHPLVFTEESYNVCSAGEFWLEALFHLGNEAGNERWKKTYEELLLEKDGVRLRERALSQLIGFAEAKNKKILLMVENMGMLFGGQINDNEAWAIRHTLLNEPRIMLIGTALQKFDEIENSEKAMFELFKVYELKPLTKEECGEIWMSVTGRPLEGNRIRPVQILTGGNPRLVTIISKFGADISFNALLGDLMRLVDDHTEYFKSHLDNLTPPERKVYTSLLELWAPVSAREAAAAARLEVNETSAILARLASKGAVVAAPGRGRAKSYQSAERMFNIYWLMRRQGEPSRRVKAVVEFMVHFYGEKEIGGVVRSIAEETRALGAGERKLHYSAYQEILRSLPSDKLKEKCLEFTPLEFFNLSDAPEEIKNIAKGEASNCYKRGLLAYKAERFEEAAEEFRKSVKLDPQAPSLFALGVTYGKLSQPKAAIESFDKALDIDPRYGKAWCNKGIALSGLGNFEAAIECFDKGIALDPDYAEAWNNKGVLFGRLGKDESAVECYDKATKIDPGYFKAWNNKGVALGKLERHEAALECFAQAVTINPGYAEAWYNKGVAFGKLGKPVQELECYDKTTELNPEDSDAWRNKGLAFKALGKLEAAIECYDKAIKIIPEYAEAWCNKGVALRDLGKSEEAIVALDNSVKMNPSHVVPWLVLNRLLIRLKRKAEVVSNFKKYCESSERIKNTMDAVITLGVDMAAADFAREAINILMESPAAPLVEPLVAGLRIYNGEEITVPVEVREIAQDVVERIKEKRAEQSMGKDENAPAAA